jgi:hypothetical protein
MSQPAQVKFGLPDGSFNVVDNGSPGVTSTNNVVNANGGSGNWSGAGAVSGGFDLCANGSISQGQNSFTNGTVPDFVASQKSIAGISVSYKNPS